MKKTILSTFLYFVILSAAGQSPVGNWKKISHLATYDGQTFDSHKALLVQRPCAEKIIYRITTDGNYRLDASSAGCDESYRNIQERLWNKTKWKLEGNKFSTSATNFAVSNEYTITFVGNRMIWKSTDGDVVTYQRTP